MEIKYKQIYTLVENEINWLLDNSGERQSVIEFFASGGFYNWSDEDINQAYKELIG
jgi:hypothetical protein